MISILLATYNRAELLRRCINSLLVQTHKKFELVIADDGSEDNTEEIVKSFADKRIKYLKFKHAGVYQARNKALKSCKGSLIAVVDDDDVYHPDHIETLYAEFKNNPKLGCAYGGAKRVSPDGKLYDVIKPMEFSIPRLLHRMLIMHGTTMWRRRWMEKCPYPTQYDFAGDYIFMLEAARKGCMYKSTGKITYTYYMYSDSISRRIPWDKRRNLCSLYIDKFINSFTPEQRWQYGREAGKLRFERYMEEESPKISICIMSYGQERGVKRIIDQLKGLYSNLEFVVANDGGSHPTFNFNGTEIKYFWHPHHEARRATIRNSMMKLASGEVLIFIDADMIPPADYLLPIMLRHFENKNLLLIHAIREGNEIRRSHNHRLWQCMGGAFSIRKSTALRIGLMDEQFNGGWGFEDTDWAYRAHLLGISIEYARDIFVKHIPHVHLDMGDRNRKLFEQKHKISTITENG